ncbi:MAG: tetratricopeptide repeat protein [Elusimicrobia bacterium]|nr:tetratricopeptide repeat protein [Elusimicrobiota bacterium]
MAKARGKAPAPAWEAFLERGRLEEKKGRMAQAERAFRRALRAGPSSNSLAREFSRFLESRGRHKEAAAQLLRAMELGWPRAEGEPTLARLREKTSPPPKIEPGSFEEEAKALEEAPAGSPEGGDALWPQVFSALLCEHKYREAFRLGDAMLKKSARTPYATSFLWPWWHAVSSRGSVKKMKFCARELEFLGKARAGGEFAAWFAYCRGVLLLSLGRNAEAAVEYGRIRRLRSPRYSLLHHPFVMQRLLAGDFKWTIATCRVLLKNVPEYWWLHCRMAEALMAGGDVAGGLREFERAAAIAGDDRARQAIMTWHGAALLWAGKYRRALAMFDKASGLGTKIWVNCWRGGACLKLGENRKALAELDLAIKTDHQDLEAYLWRGEALRLLGRHAEALNDLDRAIALDANYTWAYFNRALVRGARGDAKGMAADYAMIPRDVVAALGGAPKAGAAALTPKEMRAVLESGLKRAKGIRRPEHYLNSIWMGRAKRSAGRARG